MAVRGIKIRRNDRILLKKGSGMDFSTKNLRNSKNVIEFSFRV